MYFYIIPKCVYMYIYIQGDAFLKLNMLKTRPKHFFGVIYIYLLQINKTKFALYTISIAIFKVRINECLWLGCTAQQ